MSDIPSLEQRAADLVEQGRKMGYQQCKIDAERVLITLETRVCDWYDGQAEMLPVVNVVFIIRSLPNVKSQRKHTV